HEEQNKNDIEIANRGARLYEKLSDFVKDLESVGKALGSARDTYDAAFSKLYLGKGSALRQAQMLVELGVKASKSLPDRLVELAAAEDATPVTRQLGPVVGEVIEVLENAAAEQKVETRAGGPITTGSEARGPLI
ncbi:MAG: DNA recombination protein RmuC, partial [Betaproteobacteria bacterium]